TAPERRGRRASAAQVERPPAGAGRGLRVFSPDGPGHWNPLAHGNATALKDKLISTERFSEPHYQRAAERQPSAEKVEDTAEAALQKSAIETAVVETRERRHSVKATGIVSYNQRL